MIKIKYNNNKEIFSDSLAEYQETIDYINEYKNTYKYVADPEMRSVISYICSDITEPSGRIQDIIEESNIEIIGEHTYERHNGHILLLKNKVKKIRFLFDNAEIKVRYIREESKSSDQTGDRLKKIVKIKFIGCCINEQLREKHKKKKGEKAIISLQRIVLRERTFLLKKHNSNEPIDCIIKKGDYNPYSETKLFTMVYIPVLTFKNMKELEEDMKSKKRLTNEDFRRILGNII